MKDAYNLVMDKLENWGEGLISMLPNIIAAVLVAIVFYFLSKGISKLFSKLISKVSNNEAINKLLSKVISVIILIAGLFIALGILDLDKTVTSLLAGAGVVGLAIGLAFQDPILNVLSGIIMSMREPFNIGDQIESNGFHGTIQKISLRSTKLKKFTGEDVIIPNKMVIQNPLVNYTLTNHRRVDIACGVGYEDDLELAQKTAIEAIENNIDHEDSRPVELFYNEFGDSSINFNLRFWLNMSEQKNYLDFKSKAIIELKKAFDKEGINIPFPIRTLTIDEGSQLDNRLKGGESKKNSKNKTEGKSSDGDNS